MFFQRLKSPGLAQHSYVVGCGEGQALVVDPRRDIAEYLDLTREHGLTIAYVLATHRQEDFEIGSVNLAQASGAAIVTGTHERFGRSDMRLADGAVPVHCSVGNRAGLAASILARAGHTNVYNMLGGIKAWNSLGLPLDTDDRKEENAK